MYDKSAAVRHLVFKASRWASLPLRDAVVLEAAQQRDSVYMVIQRSVGGSSLPQTPGAARVCFPIAGYVLRSHLSTATGQTATRLIHFAVIAAPGLKSAQVARLLLSYCANLDLLSFSLSKGTHFVFISYILAAVFLFAHFSGSLPRPDATGASSG